MTGRLLRGQGGGGRGAGGTRGSARPALVRFGARAGPGGGCVRGAVEGGLQRLFAHFLLLTLPAVGVRIQGSCSPPPPPCLGLAWRWRESSVLCRSPLLSRLFFFFLDLLAHLLSVSFSFHGLLERASTKRGCIS